MRVRVIGVGRAGGSFERALATAGWDVAPGLGRGGPIATAADGVDLVLITTPDAAVAEVAAQIEPVETTVVAHASGALGPDPVAHHLRHAVVHPLVALPDPERGASRLVGAWFGLAVGGDPLGERIVADLQGWAVPIEPDAWVRYHAAAVIAANHLVALLGHAERVAAGVGLPLAALMDLAAGSLADVADLGPARALTGPVRRGDLDTVRRHLAAVPEAEREAYRVMSEQAARLLTDAVSVSDVALASRTGADPTVPTVPTRPTRPGDPPTPEETP